MDFWERWRLSSQTLLVRELLWDSSFLPLCQNMFNILLKCWRLMRNHIWAIQHFFGCESCQGDFCPSLFLFHGRGTLAWQCDVHHKHWYLGRQGTSQGVIIGDIFIDPGKNQGVTGRLETRPHEKVAWATWMVPRQQNPSGSIQMNKQLAFGRGHRVTPQYKSAMVYPRDIIQIKLFTKSNASLCIRRFVKGFFILMIQGYLASSNWRDRLGARKQHKVLATTIDSTSTLT